MNGAVVINGYLKGSSFEEPADMIIAAAERRNIGIRRFYNSELSFPIGDTELMAKTLHDVDFVVFWDKDVNLAKNLEVCDMPVFNCSECIRLCDDKSLTHLVLADWGVPSIKTLASPMTFGNRYDDWIDKVMVTFQYPFVAKDCFGSFGQQVRIVRDRADLEKELSSPIPKIFQEYIECNGEDQRLEVVGNKVVAAVKRKAPEGDFRSNVSNGGTMSKYEPTEQEKLLAIDAANAVEADFCGVDIIRTEKGPVVCEVNSNAHIKNLYNATGIDVSDHILAHIENLLK